MQELCSYDTHRTRQPRKEEGRKRERETMREVGEMEKKRSGSIGRRRGREEGRERNRERLER